MLGAENGEMSTIPGLNQIQFEGFCGFMDRGLTEELYKEYPSARRVYKQIQIFVIFLDKVGCIRQPKLHLPPPDFEKELLEHQ
ncbi:hypothetical protein V6N13_093705 [Hibiscus sabdariffa]